MQVYRGPAEVRQWFSEALVDFWDALHFEREERAEGPEALEAAGLRSRHVGGERRETSSILGRMAEGENLRAFLEAWSRVEADMSLLDPDVTYEDTVLPDHVGETYRGHAGMVRAAERWADPFESLTIELERIVGAGDPLVSIHRVQVTARHTGIEFDGPLAYLWRFRDGMVIHIQSFRDPKEALETAGLRE